MNSLYNHALKQVNTLQRDLDKFQSGEDTSVALQGIISSISTILRPNTHPPTAQEYRGRAHAGQGEGTDECPPHQEWPCDPMRTLHPPPQNTQHPWSTFNNVAEEQNKPPILRDGAGICSHRTNFLPRLDVWDTSMSFLLHKPPLSISVPLHFGESTNSLFYIYLFGLRRTVDCNQLVFLRSPLYHLATCRSHRIYRRHCQCLQALDRRL